MRVISIDVGLNNFVVVTNNIGKEPILIRGKQIKSQNQWYNKRIMPIKAQLDISSCDEKEKQRLNRKISSLAEATISKIFVFFENVSDWIIAYCRDNRIDEVLIGAYEIKEKENFISIPFQHFYSLVETKCKYHNIKYTLVDEKYTSGTSFFDDEPPTRIYYNKKRRVYKHLWRCNNGDYINADVNDSYQIMRKAHPEFFKNGITGYLSSPRVVDINKKKEM